MGPRVKQDGQERVPDFSAGCLGVDDPNGLSCLPLDAIVIRMSFFHLCLMFSHISYFLRSISRTLTMNYQRRMGHTRHDREEALD
jgi:hypothetical protein